MDRTRRRAIATLLVLLAVVVSGCGDDAEGGDVADAPLCGREPPPTVAAGDQLPPPLLLDDARLTDYEDTAGGFRASLLLDGSVGEVLTAYRLVAQDQGYRVGTVDDEGFEAELYATTPDGALSVVIRRSGGCARAITVGLELTRGG